MEITRGQPVTVIDAFGAELERVALTGPQRGLDMAVIWVCRPEELAEAETEGREPEGVPWPLEDVHVRELA